MSALAKEEADVASGREYVSLFSGIGGLEHPYVPPVLFCERDKDCHTVIRSRTITKGTPIHSDVRNLSAPPRAAFVIGGWPCQDLSAAGKQIGIAGERSNLFFEMLRVARSCGAHTIIGENVPNLLAINKGRDFETVISALNANGYSHISWRTLNARQFKLPQDRNRLFMVASKDEAHALALHCELPDYTAPTETPCVHGFYWTGGKRSICFSTGYVPTLKVGAADNNGRGTVAVYDGRIARKLTVGENLALQGFSDISQSGLSPSALLRMAGNAVARPVGHFVVANVMAAQRSHGIQRGAVRRSSSGYFNGTMEWAIDHRLGGQAANLAEFLDASAVQPLSAQASAGLIVRSVRSGTKMPSELFDTLYQQSINRRGKAHPSRGDSLTALERSMPEIIEYRNHLERIERFGDGN